MPDSTPNDFGLSSGGDITSQFLQLTDSYAGTRKKIDAGTVTFFVNSSFQTDLATVNHKLGVVPDVVLLQPFWFGGDSGRWIPYLYIPGGFTATQFVCFAVDMLNSSVHGPGNLAPCPWIAMGGS